MRIGDLRNGFRGFWTDSGRTMEREFDERARLRALEAGHRALAVTLLVVLVTYVLAWRVSGGRPVLPVSALRIFKGQLDALQDAGFSRRRAVEVVRTVVAYAFGAALSELCWSCAAASAESELGRLRRVSQMLPGAVPEELLAVAMELCGGCDMDGAFELGLDLMVHGLEPT